MIGADDDTVADESESDGRYRSRLRELTARTLRYSDDGPSSTYQPSYGIPYQRWYKFKEAFSPELILEYLQETAETPIRICDPFGGSGTTALTSQYLGIPSTTIELNPFLCDVIRAKAATYSRDDADRAYDRIIEARPGPDVDALLMEITQNAPVTLIEPGDGERFVFPRRVARRLLQLRVAVEREKDPVYRRFFTVLLASTLVPTSNVVINGKGRRYRRAWNETMSTARDVDSLFDAQYRVARKDFRLQQFKTSAAVQVLEGDARERLVDVPQDLDLAIFSPPYPNSFDYTDIYNLELWFLGYLRCRDDNRALRLKTLRSHVQIRHADTQDYETPKALLRALRRIALSPRGLWNARIPDMLKGYFVDLGAVISGLGVAMKNGGTIGCIVGDSIYADVLIDVPAILSEQFGDGPVRFVGARTLRRMSASAQHDWAPRLKESMVHFKVSPPVRSVGN